nr:aldo/keto reductase [Pirellulaceae bacterium]
DDAETLQREGLIRHWGCSVESIEEAKLCMAHPGCASLQVIFNVFRQKLIDELLPLAMENDVGIIVRVPLASGLLAGGFRRGQRFPEKDHRHYNADGQVFNVGETFAGVPFERGVELADQVKQIVQSGEQATMAQRALRWILDHHAVSTVIPGATKTAQAEENAAAADLPPLDPEVHRQLRDLYDREIAPAIRGPY